MGIFRKKPVFVEAIQFTMDTIDNVSDIVALSEEADIDINYIGEGLLYIETLEGVMRAEIGDWIIKGVNGEVYPCKPDIFNKTYEYININE
jgi:hypothetical protein